MGAQPGTEPGELCGNTRGLPSWQLPLRPLKAVGDKYDQFKLHTPRPGFKKKNKSSWSVRLSDAKLKEQNHGSLAELLIPGREQRNKGDPQTSLSILKGVLPGTWSSNLELKKCKNVPALHPKRADG